MDSSLIASHVGCFVKRLAMSADVCREESDR